MTPRSSELSVSVFGRSSHATAPEKGIDALFIGCRIELSHSAGYPPVVNDPALYSWILPALMEKPDKEFSAISLW